MAESNTPSQPDRYSQAFDNAQKTVGTLELIDRFSNHSITKFFKAKNEHERLKKELGQWYDFLYDKGRDVYHNPVLSSSSFKKYMDVRNGDEVFRPVGKCLATAPWAQFVHALGISPEMNDTNQILSRKAITRSPNDYDVTFEVDGDVICHVVNLLAVNLSPEWQRSASRGIYDTSIGQFVLKDSTGDDNAAQPKTFSYLPSNEADMKSPHEIFPDYRHNQRYPDTLLIRYDLALDPKCGISDLALVWPDPTDAPISERIMNFLEALRKLSILPHSTQRAPEAIMVTRSWIRSADRVRRRAAGGENAPELLRDSCRKFTASHSNAGEPSNINVGTVIKLLTDWITGKSGLGLWYYNDDDEPDSSDFATDKAIYALEEALLAYKDEELGSWKHSLSLCAEAVRKVLTCSQGIQVLSRAVYLIPFDRSSSLWQRKSLRLCTETKT